MTNIVHLGDCMQGMAQYPDKWFDLAVVDPPYMDTFIIPASDNAGKVKNDYNLKSLNGSPDNNYWIELSRISKNQIIWGVNYYNRIFGIGRIVWDKDNTGVYSDCELAYQSFSNVTRKFKYRWNGMLQQNMKQKETRIHPTQKPVALYDWIFKNYLPNGGKVIDTHIGSGSSRISAYTRGNIDFTGYELDPDYHRDQEARFREFVMKVAPAELEPITKDGQIKLF